MQPVILTVKENNNRSKYHPEKDIKEIKLEEKIIGNGESITVYRGYNFENRILFGYIAKTVNVHYF